MKFVFHANVNPGGLKQIPPKIHPTAQKQQIFPLHSGCAPLFKDISSNFNWYFLLYFSTNYDTALFLALAVVGHSWRHLLLI